MDFSSVLPKLRQIIHSEFTDFSALKDDFSRCDACFYCVGVSAAGMSKEKYHHLTYDFAMAAARELFEVNPEMTFIYVSGQGTDSTEKGRMMWARVKGKLENDLLGMGFGGAYMFRPGAIIPKRGIKSRTPLYHNIYTYFGWLLRILEGLFPNSITDTTKIGKAMIRISTHGSENSIITPRDINEAAAV